MNSYSQIKCLEIKLKDLKRNLCGFIDRAEQRVAISSSLGVALEVVVVDVDVGQIDLGLALALDATGLDVGSLGFQRSCGETSLGRVELVLVYNMLKR